MPILSQVILEGLYSTIPSAAAVGSGCLFFATDTKQIYYSTGSAWVNVTPSQSTITAVALSPSSPGNFTVAHGLGTTPLAVLIEMKSGGSIWFQSTEYDGTNLYLVASDAGVAASAKCFT